MNFLLFLSFQFSRLNGRLDVGREVLSFYIDVRAKGEELDVTHVCRRICRERLGPISHWNDRIRRSYSSDHPTGSVKSIHVWSVLVTDPKAPIIVQDNAFRVYRNTFSSWTWTTKSVSLEYFSQYSIHHRFKLLTS